MLWCSIFVIKLGIIKFIVSVRLRHDTEFMKSCLQVWAIDLDVTYSDQLAMT